MSQTQVTPAPATRSARAAGRTAARSGSRVGNQAASEGRRVASRAGDEAQQVASQAGDEAQQVASSAQQKAAEVGTLASRQAQRVKGTVVDQGSRVGEEVVEQGRTVVEEARAQVESQANIQSRRIADSLSQLGDEVRALAEGRPDDAETVKPYVANAADAVYEAADRLYGLATDIDTRGLTGVLDDLQGYARRRPAAFLVGAAFAGFGIGRAVRASSSDAQAQGSVASGRR